MSFGISQIKNHTPRWVKIAFAIIITLTTALTYLIASTNRIDNATKVELGAYIKTFEIMVFGISKLFGISKEEIIALETGEKEK